VQASRTKDLVLAKRIHALLKPPVSEAMLSQIKGAISEVATLSTLKEVLSLFIEFLFVISHSVPSCIH
jgi:hypothetical protein